MKPNQQLKYSYLLLLVFFLITGLLLMGCGTSIQAKENRIIGIVNYTPVLEPTIKGFKAGMAEQGYIEGENVTYLYHGIVETSPEAVDGEIESLLAQDVDLFLMLGTLPALRAKEAVKGTDIPIIFAPASNPVKEGIVEDIRHPGGNLTGIQTGITFSKALEWLHQIAPQATQIHLFLNPKDQVSVTAAAQLPETAQALGVEFVLHEVDTREAVTAAIETLPKEAAIFFVPTPSLEPTAEFIEVALKHGLAVGSSSSRHLEAGVLVTYGTDVFAIGKQAARLVDQVFQGTAAGDLPVETAEVFLGVNLKTAKAIGFDIPDDILRQADRVIR